MSFLESEATPPRMRVVAWLGIILLGLAALLALLGAVDLRESAFPLLMGFFAIMFVALAWARRGERMGNHG